MSISGVASSIHLYKLLVWKKDLMCSLITAHRLISQEDTMAVHQVSLFHICFLFSFFWKSIEFSSRSEGPKARNVLIWYRQRLHSPHISPWRRSLIINSVHSGCSALRECRSLYIYIYRTLCEYEDVGIGLKQLSLQYYSFHSLNFISKQNDRVFQDSSTGRYSFTTRS